MSICTNSPPRCAGGTTVQGQSPDRGAPNGQARGHLRARSTKNAGLVSEAGVLYHAPSVVHHFINAIPITIPTATAAAAAVMAIRGLTVSDRLHHGVVRGAAIGSDSMIC